MRNIRITLEYEGTAYAGWQVQDGLPTVQGTLIEAVRKLTEDPEVEVGGASRTDSGVHALGQVANFRTGSTIPSLGIQRGLNSILPPDIVVTDAAEVPDDFCARRSSVGKTYRYRILNRSCPSALERNFSWHLHRPLDLEAMREGASHMIGEHDFTSFRAADSDAPHSIRRVTSIEVQPGGDGIVEITVEGNAFLRHMVRIMVGTLVEVGKKKIAPDDVAEIIERRERASAPMTAPARGLFLVRVHYPGA